MKFVKKPIVIDAVQWRGTPTWAAVKALESDAVWVIERDNCQLLIPTFEGIMRAEPGDWIIKGVQGELYPCKPDIFAATYERVAQPVSPTHTFKPHPRFPWFCDECGYPPQDTLQHPSSASETPPLQESAASASNASPEATTRPSASPSDPSLNIGV